MRALLATMLALTLLAGCFGDGPSDEQEDVVPDDDAPVAAPDPLEVAFAMDGCTLVEIIILVPGADVAAYVPEHFSVADPARTVVGTMMCGPRAELVQRGFWAIEVEPQHPSLVSDRAVNHFWIPEHYVHDRSAFATALATVRGVAANATVVASDPLVGPYLQINSANASFTWISTGRTVPDSFQYTSQLIDPFREYFPAEGGYAYVDAQYAGTGATGVGVGSLEIAGDSAAAQVYGASSMQAGVYADYADYSGAIVGFVPFP